MELVKREKEMQLKTAGLREVRNAGDVRVRAWLDKEMVEKRLKSRGIKIIHIVKRKGKVHESITHVIE